MSDGSGLNLGQLFSNMSSSVSNVGNDMQAQMTSLMSKGNLSPEDMMKVNFQMGQYNAMLESISSATKSLTDTLKSIGQRTG